MRVKELKDGSLTIDLDSAPDSDIVKGIERSYEEDRIIEAFAILHAHIEWLMAVLYESYYAKRMFLEDLFKTGEFGEQEYRFPKLKEKLVELEIINQNEGGMLADWYSIRSRVLHRLIPYSGHKYGGWNRITRKEVEKGFNKGIELAGLFDQRSVEMNIKNVS